MNKNSFILSLAVLALCLPMISSAHETDTAHGHTEVTIDSRIESNSSSTITTSGNVDVKESAVQQLRARAQNIKNNIAPKNTLKREATSTREEKADMRNERQADRKIMASSSLEVRKEMRKDMKAEMFQSRKNIIIRQLTLSLENLKQIRTRISSRITKAETAGRDMTAAKSALVAADAKITAAGQAISALNTISVETSATTTTASTTIDLEKPRQIADSAIKAIKEAHKALVEVVKAIAQNMGLEIRAGATSTIEVTDTTATTTTP